MRLRRPVVHHGAVALSSGSRYQALPALQSIPPSRPSAGAIRKQPATNGIRQQGHCQPYDCGGLLSDGEPAVGLAPTIENSNVLGHCFM